MIDLIFWLGILVLVLCGAPLYSVFGVVSVFLFWQLPDTPLSGAANDMFSEKFADSPLLVTIPLFTFAGVTLAASGAPQRLVQVSRALFGWIPGGLAIVCLVASAIFTTFTGGSGVTIVAIGALLYPALIEEKYQEKFSLGLVTTGGSLGVLFPPSVPVIIYGVVASLDIEGLFIASLVPGLLTVAAMMLYSAVVGVRAKLERHPFDLKGAGEALWKAKWEAALPVVLVGGLMTGMLRIHEAAAFTALYVLIVELWVYKDIQLKDIQRIAMDCVVLVGAILVILATAVGLTAYLIQANVPQSILGAMQTFISSKWTFLLVLNLFLLVVGMLMDIFSAIVVVVPLISPIAAHFGINPYHLGAIFLINLEIGYLTPPFGLNLFISGFRFKKPLTTVYRAVVPFILILLVTVGLTTYVPGLSTWSSRLEKPLTLDAEPAAPTPKTDDAAPAASGAPDSEPTGETLEDLAGKEGAGETLEDLMKDGDAGDTKSADETLKELGGEAPPAGSGDPSGSEGSKKDAAPSEGANPREGETLDDLMKQDKAGETLDDL